MRIRRFVYQDGAVVELPPRRSVVLDTYDELRHAYNAADEVGKVSLGAAMREAALRENVNRQRRHG